MDACCSGWCPILCSLQEVTRKLLATLIFGGGDIKISGAVSMDDNGVIVAPGNMEHQMKNCYSDLEKILTHFGYSFDDVVAENVYTTNMEEFLKVSISPIQPDQEVGKSGRRWFDK
jgi:enamine deaminase RidA (YjgF/YER057c/UK114 family)